MPLNTTEILNVLSELGEDDEFRNTVKQAAKGAGITGAAAVVGGIFLGPIGLAVGGAVGGIATSLMYKDKFKSLKEVINDMPEDKRKRLAASVKAVIADLGVQDAALLLPRLRKDSVFRDTVLKTVSAFFEKEMQLKLVY